MISDRYLRHALFAVIGFIPLITGQASERDPLDVQAAVLSASYQSAFTDYKNYQDPELMSWRTANDDVRAFGSMTGMKGMGDKQGMDNKENMAGRPKQDMKEKNGKIVPPRPKESVSSDGKSSEMGGMPAHDMDTMKGNAASLPAAKSPASAGKSAPSAPQAMPNHSGMQKP